MDSSTWNKWTAGLGICQKQYPIVHMVDPNLCRFTSSKPRPLRTQRGPATSPRVPASARAGRRHRSRTRRRTDLSPTRVIHGHGPPLVVVDAIAKWPPLGGRKWIELFPIWTRGGFWGDPAPETPTILTVSMSIDFTILYSFYFRWAPAVCLAWSHHLLFVFACICSYSGLAPITVRGVVLCLRRAHRAWERGDGLFSGSVSSIESSCDLRPRVRKWPATMLAMLPTRGMFDARVAMSHRCCRIGP